MEWLREGEVLPSPAEGDPDGVRATHPWVLEDEAGVLRMW
jgi:hypothetical protein